MGGSSLWLVPHPDSALYRTLSTLITTTVPALLASEDAEHTDEKRGQDGKGDEGSGSESGRSTPPPPVFIPHLTLTADVPISSYAGTAGGAGGPQEWLEGLELPLFSVPATGTRADDSAGTGTGTVTVTRTPSVHFTHLAVGNTFVTKVTLRVEKTTELKALAAACRAGGGVAGAGAGAGGERGAEEWAERSWRPHVSLL
ncbi:MAG: hypothetical protein M1819_000006 [Sarea resinae]|nr:MAG: hypothetical protein M1819_000006 [Sarea resinae]